MGKRRAATKGSNTYSFVKPTEKRKLLARKPGVPVDIKKRKATLQEVVTRVRRIEGAAIRTAQAVQNAGPDLGGKPMKDILENTEKIVRSFTVDRSFLGRNVVITNAAQEIIPSSYARGYKLINPAQSAGLTTQGVIQSATTSLSGNTQSAALGVANYRRLRLFLNVTSITGTLDINAQSQLPTAQIAGTWVDTQASIFSVTATGQYYADIDLFGVDFNFAISWSGPSAVNFSVGYVLKDGLVGSAGGLTQTVYIGSGNGVNATNGFPLLEGQEFSFFAAENTSIWAISAISSGITLKIFELQ